MKSVNLSASEYRHTINDGDVSSVTPKAEPMAPWDVVLMHIDVSMVQIFHESPPCMGFARPMRNVMLTGGRP